MTTNEQVVLNEAHEPHENAIQAFEHVIHDIKHEILKSRHDWDIHEPRMWSRAAGISDKDLVGFDLRKDLVLIRSGPTSYGTIIFGKIRVPAIHDSEGEGFIHVRIHDPPNRGTDDVKFHSIFTDEGNKDELERPTNWRAIQTRERPLEFFNE